MNFADKLITQIIDKRTPACVGLDPQMNLMPQFLKDEFGERYGNTREAAAAMFLEFNKKIIEAVSDLVPAVKLNMAFYEEYGFPGVKCFEETAAYARAKNLMILEDAKRNDVANTALAYARGSLGEIEMLEGGQPGYDVDALVVNAYMGSDTVLPFLPVCQKYAKGIFILAKTSNSSAGELQDLEVNGEKIYEMLGRKAREWGQGLVGEKGYSSVGLVVGATWPREAAALRQVNPEAIFLVPGYGRQKADPENINKCFNTDGLGAVVNNSRGIDYAYLDDKNFTAQQYPEAARQAVEHMIADIRNNLKKSGKPTF